MEEKTNVMRMLEKAKIPYKSYCYAETGAVNGVEIAEILHQNQAQVFKTLVTISRSRKPYVFVIPVAEELDLKKAAASVQEKAVDMIKQKELLPMTGYVHGGCSPIGMKKLFVTTIHETALSFPTIIFSAGRVGYQVEVAPEDLKKVVPIQFASLV